MRTDNINDFEKDKRDAEENLKYHAESMLDTILYVCDGVLEPHYGIEYFRKHFNKVCRKYEN